MATADALMLPPGDESEVGILERDAGYRHRYVLALLNRLFPTTLSVVKEIECLGAEGFDEQSPHLCTALRVISIYEHSHFDNRTGDDTAPSCAIDGLYVACRGLATEAMFRGSATKDILERLAASWCTTMRLVMSYEATSSNATLKSVCARSKQWIRKAVDDAVEGAVTWPFWKSIKACINWCCMFHSENDFGCPYGSPRLGQILSAVSPDDLMLSLAPSLMSWTYGPCIIRGNDPYINATSARGAPGRSSTTDAQADPGAADPTGDDSPVIVNDESGSGGQVRVDAAGRPVAVVRPNCSWVEYMRIDVDGAIFDGPPFRGNSSPDRESFLDAAVPVALTSDSSADEGTSGLRDGDRSSSQSDDNFDGGGARWRDFDSGAFVSGRQERERHGRAYSNASTSTGRGGRTRERPPSGREGSRAPSRRRYSRSRSGGADEGALVEHRALSGAGLSPRRRPPSSRRLPDHERRHTRDRTGYRSARDRPPGGAYAGARRRLVWQDDTVVVVSDQD